MPGASEIKAGAAFVTIGTKDSAFEAGLKKAEKRLHAFGKSVAMIGGGLMAGGAAVLTPLVGFVKSFVDTGVELQHLHEQLGMSVEDLSALKAMAQEAGMPLEDLANDFFKFQVKLSSGKAGDILRKIGVNGAELNGKTTAEQLILIANAFGKLDQGMKSEAAKELFGKGGRPMIELLSQGGDAMRRRLGQALFTSEDAAQATEFHHSLLNLERAAKGAAMALGGELVKAMNEYAQPIVKGAQALGNFIREHKHLVLVIAGVGVGVIAAGAALVAFGAALSAAGTVIGVLAGAIGFALTPIGLLTVAATGLAAAWLSSCNGIRSGLAGLAADFKESFGGIMAAIKVGDIELAWEIMLTTLKIEWSKFKEWLKREGSEGWSDFADDMQTGAAFALVNIGKLLGIINADQQKELEQILAEDNKHFKEHRDALSEFRKLPPEQQTEQRLRQLSPEDQAKWGREQQLLAERSTLEDKRQDLIKKAKNAEEVENIDQAFLKLLREFKPGAPHAEALAEAATSTKGMFSPYAIAESLARNDSVNERIATAGEKTADNTGKMVDKLDELTKPKFA